MANLFPIVCTLSKILDMNPYKHWSSSFRSKSLRLTNKAKTHGWIPEPTSCSTCGKANKKLDLHNSDYDVTYNTLKDVFSRKPVSISKEEKRAVNAVLLPLCRSCHLKIHKAERAEAAMTKTKL